MMRIKRLAACIMLLALCLTLPVQSVHADNEDYGIKAYQYVKYLNDNLPLRINNNELTTDKTRLQETRQWIVGEMASFGYTEPEYWYGENVGNEFASVVFHKAGKSDKTIVIGAHFDCVDTKGAEDNGTGVGLLLELADRFKDTETNLSIDFCFWDGEEFIGMAGSARYVYDLKDYNPERFNKIFCYINLDSVGSGDRMHVYGGKYGEDGVLYQSWGYNMAMTLAWNLGVELHEMPAGIDRYIPPTRSDASDQYYFYVENIPYMYFEANAWLKPDGSVGNPEKPYNYNSTLPCFEDTNGRIIHTKYDDLSVLEELVPGRIQEHLTGFSKVISQVIREMDEQSPEKYQHYVSEAELRAAKEAETETQTEEETVPETSESEDTSEETETEPETKTEATETSSETAIESTEASESTSETAIESAEDRPLLRNRSLMWVYIGGCSIAAVILILLSIAFSKRR